MKAQVNFLSNFASIFSVIKHNSHLLFLAQTLYTLVKRAKWRANLLDFRVFDSKFFKFLMSILKWHINWSSNFTSFFIVMTYNSSVNFKLIRFLLWRKGSQQSPNFDTFKCSGENFPNCSFHFSNHKSDFQILHHSSVPWKITPLSFFRSNSIYFFTQKEPIKGNIFVTLECSDQNLSNSSCQFWNDNLIPYQILNITLQCHER